MNQRRKGVWRETGALLTFALLCGGLLTYGLLNRVLLRGGCLELNETPMAFGAALVSR